jgi:predicted ATP-dependent serine protease
MSQNVIWECPACNEQTRFKGLCRECTEYEDGIPVKPVHRIRPNHTPSQKETHKRTRSDYINQRRPHPSKKQMNRIKDSLNASSMRLDDKGEDVEGDFVSVGEIIAKAEEE